MRAHAGDEHVVITRAEVAKLGALRAVGPTMLSLYLNVPPPPVDLPALADRARELIAAGVSVSVSGTEYDAIRERLAMCARDWPGHTVAIFTCAGSGLLEAIPLPCAQPERAVLGIRPHVRPLLAALQRGRVLPPPGGLGAVGLGACLAAVNAGAVATLTVPRDGLVPGYECGRCGTLSLAPDGCPDWGTAPLPVPDVIEEMVSRTLEDGGEVTVVCDGSSPVTADLSFPVPSP